MIEPKLAPVRPRVAVPGAEGSSLLEDEVRARLESNPRGFVELMGPPGSGKSTAIAHLAQAFNCESRLLLADGPDLVTLLAAKLLDAAANHLVIYASPPARPARTSIEVWRLVPWTTDDCIEYLLAMHGQECDPVMRRILADPDRNKLCGLPELYRVVLDQFANAPMLADVKLALRRKLEEQIDDIEPLPFAREYCFELICHPELENTLLGRLCQTEGISHDAFSLLRHPQTQILLAVEYLAERVQSDRSLDVLECQLPEALIRGTASIVEDISGVREKLEDVLARGKRSQHAMAASLLHVFAGGWVPANGPGPRLHCAYLSGARWAGIRLSRLELYGADLSDADLSESWLWSLAADHARLSRTRLHGAELKHFSATKAVMVGADLSFARAPGANFRGADLRQANLEGALLADAIFTECDLTGARCCRADFTNAALAFAKFADADFTGANFSRCVMQGLPLREATFTGAQFAEAVLDRCDLELMRLPGANFEKAQLHGAYLTGSHMPDSRFRGANLSNTGLADIQWERADLRDADLRGCTFHMGSSRSGLVGSPIASEGSRTGFYTDEYHEQEFKAPEEIRKANLCGADLRDANIDNVDFYLVDLRGALYTAEQEDVFRRCRAILETRV